MRKYKRELVLESSYLSVTRIGTFRNKGREVIGENDNLI